MRKRWQIIPVLLLTNVAAAALGLWLTESRRSSWPIIYGVIGLLIAQGSLMGISVGLARKGTPWRVIVAIVALSGWIWCVGHSGLGGVLAIAAVWMTLVSLIARLLGISITHADDVAARELRLQYSLRSLFGWTTAAAVALSASQYWLGSFFRIFSDPDNCLLLAMVAISALAPAWIALGTRVPWVRWMTLVAADSLAVGIVAGEPKGLVLLVLGVHAAWLLACFGLLRAAGYRLLWRGQVEL